MVTIGKYQGDKSSAACAEIGESWRGLLDC